MSFTLVPEYNSNSFIRSPFYRLPSSASSSLSSFQCCGQLYTSYYNYCFLFYYLCGFFFFNFESDVWQVILSLFSFESLLILRCQFIVYVLSVNFIFLLIILLYLSIIGYLWLTKFYYGFYGSFLVCYSFFSYLVWFFFISLFFFYVVSSSALDISSVSDM